MKNHTLPQVIQAALNTVSRYRNVELVAFTVEWNDDEGMYIIKLYCKGSFSELMKLWGEASKEVAKVAGDLRRCFAVLVEPILTA